MPERIERSNTIKAERAVYTMTGDVQGKDNVQRLGLQPAEAWATIYGSYPQIQVGLLATDVSQARQILDSSDWGVLQDRLFNYVKNFSYKVVPARGGFQF